MNELLSHCQISAADTSMLQISVTYKSMTGVSSFENGRNEKISYITPILPT